MNDAYTVVASIGVSLTYGFITPWVLVNLAAVFRGVLG